MNKIELLNKLIDHYAEKCDKCHNTECKEAEADFINQFWTELESELRK